MNNNQISNKITLFSLPKLLGLIWITLIILSFGALSYDILNILWDEWFSTPANSTNCALPETLIEIDTIVQPEPEPEPSWFDMHKQKIILAILISIAAVVIYLGYTKISSIEDRLQAGEETSDVHATQIGTLRSEIDDNNVIERVTALDEEVIIQGTELMQLTRTVNEDVSDDRTYNREQIAEIWAHIQRIETELNIPSNSNPDVD